MSENPKRNNTELFINARAKLYIQKWGTTALAILTSGEVIAKTNNRWK